ncbi:UNKNOWN [Stylonychia lemnae]|uniref:Uncharacterized protein n=1 Tax=Stylonychia lemnae TaxID=5949 RepID=A0A078AKU9_STYLE|nr:UNKNOWN [Stylonychia lemnae]|eukprot:CDW81433.1 UNKNOWN [Stylonychia lemnae]
MQNQKLVESSLFQSDSISNWNNLPSQVQTEEDQLIPVIEQNIRARYSNQTFKPYKAASDSPNSKFQLRSRKKKSMRIRISMEKFKKQVSYQAEIQLELCSEFYKGFECNSYTKVSFSADIKHQVRKQYQINITNHQRLTLFEDFTIDYTHFAFDGNCFFLDQKWCNQIPVIRK